ncbi:hypothetical protein GCM10025872_32670 [Barrientosiimonas endolithica]|uniref:HTH merR-type domain-containing protein n=1 Tax=Barrientosiimonas endolithica TaxID=1535208 RepID=A0ABM8HF17_9MICO|nr:hypothetical protein GCM10025872_32670 [Barrientosiimonas endolithica]
MSPRGSGDTAPVYVISVAAELAGMHAQTLRQYDRLGLVTPSRTGGVAGATPRTTSVGSARCSACRRTG